MALTNSYLVSVKNFEAIMNSILAARAPERFTNKFLEDLGFKSSNDRLISGVLKGLGFLSETGEPTQRYYDFLDQTQSKKVLAKGIQEAYEDLFCIRRDAQNMTQEEVKNKLKTLTQGQKGDRVIDNMARTFKTLCDYAEWDDIEEYKSDTPLDGDNVEKKSMEAHEKRQEEHSGLVEKKKRNALDLRYNIQIHLPETTNMAVYDAIFQSLRKHLM